MNKPPLSPLHKGFSFRSLLLDAFLILPPAFLYSMKVDMPHIFLIPAALLAICFLKRNYLPYTDRPIIYCVTTALVLAVVPDMIVTADEARFGLFDLMLRSSLVVPLLLYSAGLSCFFPPNPYRTGLTAALALAAMLICGDIFNSGNLSNTVLFFLNEPLRNYRTTYAVTAVIQSLALPYCFYLSTKTVYPAKKHGKIAALRFLFQLFCILLIPVFALFASKVYYANTRFFRSLELYFLRVGMRQNNGREMTVLSSSVNLNATMQPDLIRNPGKVLIRAKADAPPGYLRGGVYTSYNNGRWVGKTISQELQAVRRATILSDSTFSIRNYPGAPAVLPENPRAPLAPPLQRTELYFDGLLTRGTIPVPGNTYRLDAVADGADVTENGIFQLRQWKRDGGCTFFTTGYEPQAAYQEPKPDSQLTMELTKIPFAAAPRLKRIAERVISGRKITKEHEKITAVIGFLNKHYRYSLDFQAPQDDTDPIIHFLSHERKGHCELFASAAVLLLRAMGLPTRYVTGMVCEERHPYSQYYIARAADVHAWGEVWLPDEKRWVLVEATPASDELQNLRSSRKQKALTSFLDLLNQTFQQVFADIRRGYFADAVLTVIETAFLFLQRILRNPTALLLIALIVLFFVYRRIHGVKPKRGIPHASYEIRRLSAVFASFEKRFARKTHRKRPPEETLQAFYSKAPADVRKLVAEYENMRYRERSPSREQIQSFAQRCREILKKKAE